MNVFLENVNLSSNSGPNYFAQKLIKYLEPRSVLFDPKFKYDLKLTFIESHNHMPQLPMIQRLDGIYFNANFDCDRMNYNIKRTYELAQGVIFQTEFNKELIFNWFGEHNNYRVINNGADVSYIKSLQEVQSIKEKFQEFENVWSCAAHWHVFKRLKDNIEYFLNFSGENDCLVVAGPGADHLITHPRVFYVDNLDTDELLTLFKISKYFIHLAYLDHCPNVVIDARVCGCQIICSSTGGTKEIAGEDAIIIQEAPWDYSFLDSKVPPEVNYDKKSKTGIESNMSMIKVAKKYYDFFKETEKR